MAALIPVPFTVTRYRCPACSRTGSSRRRIAGHIARCWLNPAARACKTCVHYMPAVGEPDVGYFSEEGCAVGLPFPENVLGRPTLAIGCPKWEPVPPDSTERNHPMSTDYRIPTNGDTFANPWIACDRCRARVTHVDGPPLTNQPCGHHADANTLCPSWGPVDGCTCAERGIVHDAPRAVSR